MGAPPPFSYSLSSRALREEKREKAGWRASQVDPGTCSINIKGRNERSNSFLSGFCSVSIENERKERGDHTKSTKL